jgi:putative phosphoesterase
VRGVRATKIAVVSDTHGNLEGLRAAVKEIASRDKIDLFIHLGDNYEDSEVLGEFGYDYLRVPGVFHDLYADRRVPNRLIEEVEGWKFMLSHTRESHPHDLSTDPRPELLAASGEVDVLLFGHLHAPSIEVENGVLLVNPGHLKDRDRRGFPPSYAILDVYPGRIEAKILKAETGDVVKEISFKRVTE